MQSFKDIGLLETKKPVYLDSWSTFVQKSLALKIREDKLDAHSTLSALDSLIPNARMEPLYEALEWLSLIPTTVIPTTPISMPTLPAQPMPPIDLFAYLLAHKLRYKPHEQDMVILSHEIIARLGNNHQEEIHTSSLITYGTPKASAMARTVGLPVAFAALNVLDGNVEPRGVIGPGDPSIYKHVLEGLARVGLGMTESKRIGGNTIESRLHLQGASFFR